MKTIIILTAVLFVLPALASDEEVSPETIKNSNCKIIIHTERFTGIKDNQTIYSTATSKEECDKKAKPHRHNFYPKEIKSKKVDFIYTSKK